MISFVSWILKFEFSSGMMKLRILVSNWNLDSSFSSSSLRLLHYLNTIRKKLCLEYYCCCWKLSKLLLICWSCLIKSFTTISNTWLKIKMCENYFVKEKYFTGPSWFNKGFQTELPENAITRCNFNCTSNNKSYIILDHL